MRKEDLRRTSSVDIQSRIRTLPDTLFECLNEVNPFDDVRLHMEQSARDAVYLMGRTVSILKTNGLNVSNILDVDLVALYIIYFKTRAKIAVQEKTQHINPVRTQFDLELFNDSFNTMLRNRFAKSQPQGFSNEREWKHIAAQRGIATLVLKSSLPNSRQNFEYFIGKVLPMRAEDIRTRSTINTPTDLA